MIIGQFACEVLDHGLVTLGMTIDAAVYATIGAHQFFDLGGGGMKREFE